MKVLDEVPNTDGKEERELVVDEAVDGRAAPVRKSGGDERGNVGI